MKKIRKITLGSLMSVSLFLATSATPAHAAGLSLGKVLGQAVLHKVSGSHELPLLGSPLNNNKLMVIVPEPSPWALIALGGLVNLVAWRLRRPPCKSSD